jgi:hypothetical protein
MAIVSPRTYGNHFDHFGTYVVTAPAGLENQTSDEAAPFEYRSSGDAFIELLCT